MVILAWIKKNWKSAAVIGVLAVAAVFFWGRSCRTEDKYSRLKGVYQAYRVINKAAQAQLRDTIAEKEKRIVQLDGQIKASGKKVDGLNNAIADKDTKIAELEQVFTTLPDLESKLFNMTAQRDEWRDKFYLSAAVVTEKDNQITLLNLKVGELRAVAESYRKQYESETALRLAAEDAMRACGRKLGSAKFWGGAKNVIIGVAAGYLVYQAVKQ